MRLRALFGGKRLIFRIFLENLLIGYLLSRKSINQEIYWTGNQLSRKICWQEINWPGNQLIRTSNNHEIIVQEINFIGNKLYRKSIVQEINWPGHKMARRSVTWEQKNRTLSRPVKFQCSAYADYPLDRQIDIQQTWISRKTDRDTCKERQIDMQRKKEKFSFERISQIDRQTDRWMGK